MCFKSTKLYSGFTCSFRQWSAKLTHCKYMHGYSVSFRVTYEGDLDQNNWVWDFGGVKRAKTLIDGMQAKDWMDFMFDHTVIVAEDDPEAELFKKMDDQGIIQLRWVKAIGAEKFAELIFHKLNDFVRAETNERVRVAQVEFFENQNNSAIYCE